MCKGALVPAHWENERKQKEGVSICWADFKLELHATLFIDELLYLFSSTLRSVCVVENMQCVVRVWRRVQKTNRTESLLRLKRNVSQSSQNIWLSCSSHKLVYEHWLQ